MPSTPIYAAIRAARAASRNGYAVFRFASA
jgi:hypothetical protein